MSSYNHSTSDIEDAFSSINILNYTLFSSDYFPTSSGSISFNSSENSNIIPSVILPFYDNPCLKDVQIFYAKESHISSPDHTTPPAILTPSPVLPPSLLFNPRYFFVPKELLPPKKQIHPPSSSSTILLSIKVAVFILLPFGHQGQKIIQQPNTFQEKSPDRIGTKEKTIFIFDLGCGTYAASLFAEVRSVLEHERGSYYPDTLAVYINLAGTYNVVGKKQKLKEAKRLKRGKSKGSRGQDQECKGVLIYSISVKSN
ncbi:hypothetical protein Tco_0217725 [Tanacetum coccineum]